MAKLINLNKARKDRARKAARQKADENAATHGRSKAEKAHDAATIANFKAHLDAHKRDE